MDIQDEPVLLSILVPSYNRAQRLRALLGYLIPIVERFTQRIEIIVSDNNSTDGTEEAITHFDSPRLKIFKRDVHLPTAEENIFASLVLCQGQYIWIHGDDDIANPETLEFAIGLLETGKHDFIVFNSQFIDWEGRRTGGWLAYMHSEIITEAFTKGVCALGLTSNLAGISNAILRKGCVEAVSTDDILENSPIYAHVAWWMIAFKDKSVTVVNRPLVYYRVDGDDNLWKHFGKVAQRLNVGDYFFWTFGLMRLFKFLEVKKAIERSDIKGIFEFRRDGGSFRLLDNVVSMLSRQVHISINSVEPRNTVSAQQLIEISDWILSIDPGYFELLDIVQAVFLLGKRDKLPSFVKPQCLLNGKISLEANSLDEKIERLDAEFGRLSVSRAVHNNHMIGFVGRRANYLIYRHISGFAAFDENMSIDRDTYLRALDFDPIDPAVIYAKTETDLHKMIDLATSRERRRQMSNGYRIARAMEGIHESVRPKAHREFYTPFDESPPANSRTFIGRNLPAPVVLELGKFLCTIGLKRAGSRYYDEATLRLAASKL